MVRAAAYEEYLSPSWFGPGGMSGYEEWSAEPHTPFEPHLARSGNDGNELADIVFYTDGRISKLRRLYDFRGGPVLEDFLRDNLQKNPRLGGLLLEARKVIREKFGFGTRVALEVVTDPDATGDQELFVVIRSRFRPKIARALLSELDHGWWRDASTAAQGKMELDVE